MALNTSSQISLAQPRPLSSLASQKSLGDEELVMIYAGRPKEGSGVRMTNQVSNESRQDLIARAVKMQQEIQRIN